MPIGPLIISISGKKLLEKEKILLASKKVGGLVLFRENYDENADNPKADLKKLIDEIRAINPEIVIMVDHEGGKVWRFTKGFTTLPAAKEYGNLYEKDKIAALKMVFKDGFTMAKELLDCGIDMSLAPVVDLDGPSNVIGKLLRAYHKNPLVVAEIAEHFIRGMNKAGMPATLKHFPGHGSCVLDSHIAAPSDKRSVDQLENDMLPFKILMAKGLVGAIMSNFVTYPAIDPKNVAAFSEIWIKGCLRMGCGFNNAVMSDCLHMKGADVGENLRRFTAAQAAGNDFLMYTHQHGENLDKLLSILGQVPDTKEAAERRDRLAWSIQRKYRAEQVETTVGMGMSMLTMYGTYSGFSGVASPGMGPRAGAGSSGLELGVGFGAASFGMGGCHGPGPVDRFGLGVSPEPGLAPVADMKMSDMGNAEVSLPGPFPVHAVQFERSKSLSRAAASSPSPDGGESLTEIFSLSDAVFQQDLERNKYSVV